MRNAILLICIALAPVFQSIPAAADANPERIEIDARAKSTYAELWARQQERRALEGDQKESARPVSRRATRLVRAYVPACEGNWPDSPRSLGTLCPRATEMCAATPDPNDLGFWAFTAPAGTSANRDRWTATGEYICRGAAEAGEVAGAEPVVTAEDFRRLPIPAAVVRVQPANRRTLINIPTNFYAEAGPAILPTTVLGQPIRVRATPLRYRWIYGDGTVRTIADPGGPYPDLSAAYTYRLPGQRTLGLRTTYTGEYSVAGGAWLPIDGVASVASPDVVLTVLAAENRLVADPRP